MDRARLAWDREPRANKRLSPLRSQPLREAGTAGHQRSDAERRFAGLHGAFAPVALPPVCAEFFPPKFFSAKPLAKTSSAI
jgi:hypothetical protein